MVLLVNAYFYEEPYLANDIKFVVLLVLMTSCGRGRDEVLVWWVWPWHRASKGRDLAEDYMNFRSFFTALHM